MSAHAQEKPSRVEQQGGVQHGSAQYGIFADEHLSALAGAEGLIALHRASYELEDRFLPSLWSTERTTGGKLLGMTYRLGKLVLLDHPLDHLAFLTQHEVFGHGWRSREFGRRVAGYEVSLAPPYGPGSGLTRYDTGLEYQAQRATAHAAGVNGTALLAAGLRRRSFERGRLHYRESLLYLLSFHDLTKYVLTTGRGDSGDIANYLSDLNAYVGSRAAGDRTELEELKRKALAGLLDPYQALALYGLLARYLWAGEPSVAVPTFKVRGVSYLPSVRLQLAPYGPEFVLRHHLKLPGGRSLRMYSRYGSGPAGPSWGGGVAAEPVTAGRSFSVRMRADLWRQPKLDLEGDANGRPGSPQRLGGSVEAAVRGCLRFFLPLCAEATAGLKTRGFLRGRPLRAGPLLRVGVGVLVP